MQPPPELDTEPSENTAEKILRLTGLDVTHCPKCKGKLIAMPLSKHPP